MKFMGKTLFFLFFMATAQANEINPFAAFAGSLHEPDSDQWLFFQCEDLASPCTKNQYRVMIAQGAIALPLHRGNYDEIILGNDDLLNRLFVEFEQFNAGLKSKTKEALLIKISKLWGTNTKTETVSPKEFESAKEFFLRQGDTHEAKRVAEQETKEKSQQAKENTETKRKNKKAHDEWLFANTYQVVSSMVEETGQLKHNDDPWWYKSEYEASNAWFFYATVHVELKYQGQYYHSVRLRCGGKSTNTGVIGQGDRIEIYAPDEKKLGLEKSSEKIIEQFIFPSRYQCRQVVEYLKNNKSTYFTLHHGIIDHFEGVY